MVGPSTSKTRESISVIGGAECDHPSRRSATVPPMAAVLEHRAWTLMNKADGSTFATWEEFCDTAQPYGLGRPWAEWGPILEAAVGKQRVQLTVVAPAKKSPPPPGPGPGRGHKKEKPQDTMSPGFCADEKQAKRMRAIADRAPEAVRELFTSGLIGVNEAAKLGPKNPTPEGVIGRHLNREVHLTGCRPLAWEGAV